MIFAYVFVAVLTILIIKYVTRLLKFRRAYFKLPALTDYRYTTGTLHQYPGFNEEGLAYDCKASEKCVYFHVQWLGPLVPVITIFHPDIIRPILKSAAPKPRNKYLATAYDMAVRWLGEGLLISNGAKWARSRRLLTPAFHFDILKKYIYVYNTCGDLLISRIRDVSKSNKSFDLYPLINLSALDIILRCAFFYKSDCQTADHTLTLTTTKNMATFYCQTADTPNTYISVIKEIQSIWTERSPTPMYFNELIYSFTPHGKKFYHRCDIAHKVSEEIIEKRKKELEKDPSQVQQRKVNDFLDTLLTAKDENGVGLSFLEIRNEVDTFLFEGHYTTASGMTWTLYALAQHPEHQEHVYEEIMEVLQGRQHLEWNDLSKLEFTTMCKKEGLRHHAAVPVIQRNINEDINIHGHILPAGSRIVINLYALHHNPHVWESPMAFKPERFHPDNQKNMDPFQFVPFSAGPKNCIGQNFAMNEMKITISKVIQNFELTVDSSHEARRQPIATMKPEKGVYIHATPREKNAQLVF